MCQEDQYLKELVRYIHLNLLRASLIKDILELSQNSWSGHSALMGKVKREWQNSEYVLSFFGQNRYRRRNYQHYVQKGWLWDDSRNWLAVGWLEVWGLVGSFST